MITLEIIFQRMVYIPNEFQRDLDQSNPQNLEMNNLLGLCSNWSSLYAMR